MDSAMTLLAMIISYLCFYLASTSSGSFTSSFTNLSRSFSYRMSMILYFHALNFSAPSRFSSSLVFFVIFRKLRTSNGKRWKDTYLHKAAPKSSSSRGPRVWNRNPNFVVRITGGAEWWKRCALLRWGILYLPFLRLMMKPWENRNPSLSRQ